MDLLSSLYIVRGEPAADAFVLQIRIQAVGEFLMGRAFAGLCRDETIIGVGGAFGAEIHEPFLRGSRARASPKKSKATPKSRQRT
jgi:hypothetical protein